MTSGQTAAGWLIRAAPLLQDLLGHLVVERRHRRVRVGWLRSTKELRRSTGEHRRSTKGRLRSTKGLRRSTREHQGAPAEHEGAAAEHEGAAKEHQGAPAEHEGGCGAQRSCGGLPGSNGGAPWRDSDALMRMDAASLPIRLAGLDHNPGWLPDYGFALAPSCGSSTACPAFWMLPRCRAVEPSSVPARLSDGGAAVHPDRRAPRALGRLVAGGYRRLGRFNRADPAPAG